MLMTHSWRTAFPALAGIPYDVSDLLDRHVRHITLQKGALIFGQDNLAENLLLLVSGTVRVQRLSEDGRKSARYRVHAGETCGLMTACLLAFEEYSAEGIAETDVEAILVPRGIFDELMSTSTEFRALVFDAYSKRITDLLLVIEGIAINRTASPRSLNIRSCDSLTNAKTNDKYIN